MEKITKEPHFGYSVFVVLLIFIGLFILRVSYQHRHKKPEEIGYEYGLLISKKESFTNVGVFSKLGQEALNENRFDDAREIYEFALKHFPENAELWLGLAETHLKEGYKEKGLEPLEKAAQLKGNDANLWYRLADLYYLLGKFEKAKPAIDRAVHLAPENTLYKLKQAHLDDLTGDYLLSKRIFEELLKKDPENSQYAFAYMKVSNWSKQRPPVDPEKVYRNQIEDNLNKDNEVAFQHALNDYRALFGETPAYQILLAQYIYKNYIKVHPKDAEAYYTLALFYFRYNKPEQAWEAIQEAVQLNPKNIQYLFVQANIASELDKDEEKIATYEKILALDPDHPKLKEEIVLYRASKIVTLAPTAIQNNPYLMKALFYIDEKRYVEALTELDNYAKTEGTDPLFQSLLTLIVVQLDKRAVGDICAIENLIHLAKALLDMGEEIRDMTYTFQAVMELVTRQIVCKDPCCIDNLNMYATAVRFFEPTPLPDFVIAQRIYSDILLIDPCDSAALRNLAYVTSLWGDVDDASDLYEMYVRQVGMCNLPPDAILEYANVLESQGNNSLALKYLGRYSCCFDQCNPDYYLTLQHQFNSAERPSPAFAIATKVLACDPCSYEGWLNYTRAAALLNYPYASLWGLEQIQKLQPANPLTLEAEWLVLLPLLSNLNGGGCFHQERVTGLTQWSQFVRAAYTLWPGTQVTAGFSGFETSAALTAGTVILGLGDLRQVNGEKWAGEYGGWFGFNHYFTRQFILNFRAGAAHTDAADELTTIIYGADFFLQLCDNLEVNLYSSYDFYNYSPRSLSLFIRRWRNNFEIDWWANLDNHILSFWDFNCLTDGNQFLEIYVYPRHTIYNALYWKHEIGLMGNWLMARKEVQHGYYSPHLFQAYAVEYLIDYIINDFSVIKLENTLGLAKDTFNTRFGFLANSQLHVLYNFSLHWYVEFNAEYYYEDTSLGYFDYMEFSGLITHRF